MNQEFVDFVMSQPDDRAVDMTNNRSSDVYEEGGCGCLMIQFGHNKGWKNLRCGMVNIFDAKYNTIFSLDCDSDFIDKCIANKVKTFGAAKEILEKYL